MEVSAIISNYKLAQGWVEHHGIPFLHMPVTKDTTAQQKRELLQTLKRFRADLVVLARHMQIFSDSVCAEFPYPAINIHHSFLPSFKSALHYQQAHERGVKLIGATAGLCHTRSR